MSGSLQAAPFEGGWAGDADSQKGFRATPQNRLNPLLDSLRPHAEPEMGHFYKFVAMTSRERETEYLVPKRYEDVRIVQRGFIGKMVGI